MHKRIRASIIAVTLLRGALSEGGLTLETFAAKAGIAPRTAAMARRGWLVTPRMLRRIEAGLGCAIWSSDAEFARQQALTAWLGFDPFVLNHKAARAFAKVKGIRISGKNPSKALVIARLFAAYDAAHTPPPARRKRAAKQISTVGIPPTEKAPNPK